MNLWREPDRRRLVGLCAAVSGDRSAAEDLAQETLLEAWRNRHKLRDPSGADRWLAAIARNVCLRWARRRGRDASVLTAGDHVELPGVFDVEAELERAELVDLLDRALALIPPMTRDVLVQRYVHDSPHAEIAARLGVSEDAVSMRISRGKVVLRAALGSQLREEASAYGLVVTADEWRGTRVWCASCGERTLQVRRDEAVVSFRCPGCASERPTSELSLANPFFADLVRDVIRPTAILSRLADWSRRYFAGDDATCTRCGRDVHVRRYVREGLSDDHVDRVGLFAECEACGEQVSSSVGGLALGVAEARRFRKDHRRIALLPLQEGERSGARTLVVRLQDVSGEDGLDVTFARDSLRVLDVDGSGVAAA